MESKEQGIETKSSDAIDADESVDTFPSVASRPNEEQTFELLFPKGRLGLRIVPLWSGRGAVFAGWANASDFRGLTTNTFSTLSNVEASVSEELYGEGESEEDEDDYSSDDSDEDGSEEEDEEESENETKAQENEEHEETKETEEQKEAVETTAKRRGAMQEFVRPEYHEQLQLGDRLRMVNDTYVLDKTFREIVLMLNDNTDSSRLLQWATPCNTYRMKQSRADLSIWINPTTEAYEGASLAGFAQIPGKSLHRAYKGVRIGTPLLAVNDKCLVGLPYLQVVRLLRASTAPRVIRFGIYKEAGDKVYSADTQATKVKGERLYKTDAFRQVTGRPFGFQRYQHFIRAIRDNDVRYVAACLSSGQFLHQSDDQSQFLEDQRKWLSPPIEKPAKAEIARKPWLVQESKDESVESVGIEQAGSSTSVEEANFAGDSRRDFPPLIAAVQSGNLFLVEALLAEGCDRNERNLEGQRAAHVAASLGQVKALRRLIQNMEELNDKDDEGRICMHLAVMRTQLETVQCLLDIEDEFATGGSRSNKRGYLSEKSLSSGSSATHDQSIRIQSKQVHERESRWGWTPLHFAAQQPPSAKRRDIALVNLLVNYGADPGAMTTTSIRKTCLTVAREANRYELAGILHESLAQRPCQRVWPTGSDWLLDVDSVVEVTTESTSSDSLDLNDSVVTTCTSIQSLNREPLVSGDSGTFDPLRQRYGADVVWRHSPLEYNNNIESSRELMVHRMTQKRRFRSAYHVQGRLYRHDDYNHIEDSLPFQEFDVPKPKGGGIWIGSVDSANENCLLQHGIQAMLLLVLRPGPNLDFIPDFSHISDQIDIAVVTIGMEDPWKSIVSNLPKMVNFIHDHYSSGSKVLVCGTMNNTEPIDIPAAVVLATLMIKYRVKLNEGMQCLNERCYFFSSVDAKRKDSWIRTEKRRKTVTSKELSDIYMDNNTCAGDPDEPEELSTVVLSHNIKREKKWKHNADGWVPGHGRASVKGVLHQGLEHLSHSLQNRRIEGHRTRQIEFAKKFYTHLD